MRAVGKVETGLEGGRSRSDAPADEIERGNSMRHDDEYEDNELPESEHCEMCGGPAVSMGFLGDVEWFRCRNCGWENAREEN